MDHELFAYKIEYLLGKGGFGEVYKGKYKKTGEVVAIKVIKNFESDPVSKRELENLRGLTGENIVRLIDFTILGNTAYLIMELCDGDVATYVLKIVKRKLTDSEMKDFIRQTTSGLTIIHDKKIVHRDIKPLNILFVRKGNKILYKLADFGLSKMISGTQYMTYCGTGGFMAPEVKSQAHANNLADIWSLGKTFCFIISRNYNDLEYEDKTEGNLKDLISRMLRINVRERITADKILSHPYLRN
uniref:Serine/threonine kinase ATG1-2 n=1 Tax=Dugesia japonica TaxID=6161 RepID=A0A8F2DAL8_DUGJA|nr:serine/threonine kinase ATG1-2 [Dugesia japonica]